MSRSKVKIYKCSTIKCYDMYRSGTSVMLINVMFMCLQLVHCGGLWA